MKTEVTVSYFIFQQGPDKKAGFGSATMYKRQSLFPILAGKYRTGLSHELQDLVA